MSNQPSSDQSALTSNHHTIRVLATAAIGAVLLVVSGLTLTGTVMCLIIATPLLVLFSPVLVPGGIVMFLAATGFLISGVFGVAALSALSWIYEYITGKHPPGSEHLDYARMKMANKAKDLKERAKEYGQYVQSKTQEATAAANQGGQMQSGNKTQEATAADNKGGQVQSGNKTQEATAADNKGGQIQSGNKTQEAAAADNKGGQVQSGNKTQESAASQGGTQASS